jgi:hypothetical protein
MAFRVGGDAPSIAAKTALRAIEAGRRAAPEAAEPVARSGKLFGGARVESNCVIVWTKSNEEARRLCAEIIATYAVDSLSTATGSGRMSRNEILRPTAEYLSTQPTCPPEADFTLDGGSTLCYYESTMRAVLAERDSLAEKLRVLSAAHFNLLDDRDSWRDQCSSRVADAVQFAEERDAARQELEALRSQYAHQAAELITARSERSALRAELGGTTSATKDG